LPIAEKELKLKTVDELEEIDTDDTARIKFIEECFLNNKYTILKEVEKSGEFLVPVVEAIIDYFQ